MPLESEKSIIAKYPFSMLEFCHLFQIEKKNFFYYLGIPQGPSKLQVGHQTEDSVTLKWDKPKSDGGSKITAYQVEIKRPDSDLWEVVNDYPVKGTEFTIDNLQKGKPYEFRVKAKNAAGWSDYSELDRPVTLKPDCGMLHFVLSNPKSDKIFCFLSCIVITWYARSKKS